MRGFIITCGAVLVLVTSGYGQNAQAVRENPPTVLVQRPMPPGMPGVRPGTPGLASPLPGAASALGAVPAGGTGRSASGITVVQTLSTDALLGNLTTAVKTAAGLSGLLTAGTVWVVRSPAGEWEVRAALVYQGFVVGLLRFDPVNGTVLPLGVHPHAYSTAVDTKTVSSHLASLIGDLRVLPAAEFVQEQACWLFPVALGNSIVSVVKVYYDGTHIVQDYDTTQQMAEANFGQLSGGQSQ